MKSQKKHKMLTGVMAIVALAAGIVQAETRTWTAVDGRTVTAEFGGISGSGANMNVMLNIPGKGAIPFPLSKLSEADKKWVTDNMKSAPKDARSMAAEIDRLVLAKMKESYAGLQKELAELPAKQMDAKDKAKRAEELKTELEMCAPNPKTNDFQFVRRVYLDIAGRIPTFDEASEFLATSGADKRSKLIRKLLDSEGYAMHMFNYYSDLLRIRDGLTMGGGNGGLRADPYIEWVKDCAREDKPFNAMVKEMIMAEGTIWDNPASGYLVTDDGQPLCSVSNTFTVFLGTEITCAQCHDHPFEEVYQMDYYKMASFMGNVRTRGGGDNMMGASRKDLRSEQQRLNQLLKDGGKLGPNQNQDQQLGQIFGAHGYAVGTVGSNDVKLPHDYKYDDGEPLQQVKPAAYFGDPVNLEKFASPREAYAEWMTSKTNPRFTINLVNRLWKRVFGMAQIEPVYNIPGNLAGQAENYDLLVYLEGMMKDLDYKIKDFLEVLYNSETYQREAETLSPSLVQIDNGTYHFPGPVLRRMTAEQLWDSLVTLTTSDPEGALRRGGEKYKELMNMDTSALTSADQVEQYKKDVYGIGGAMASDSQMDTNIGGVQMIRASEMRLPQAPNHFMRMFGQSDKQLIENQYYGGSSPQVMALLNGSITNKVLTNKDAYLIKTIAESKKGGKGDKVDKIFLSILGRYPQGSEKSAASSGLRTKLEDGQTKEMAEVDALGDVIWALVNTREFLFVQ
ncbi:MAG: DUF1549 domain-containing protein [Verrucomicrobiales bacterium]|nr:DUF1549 domain-containing protein [Verrucomicrobiales bacterium]